MEVVTGGIDKGCGVLHFQRVFNKIPLKRLFCRIKAHNNRSNILARIEDWLTEWGFFRVADSDYMSTVGICAADSANHNIWMGDIYECRISKFSENMKLVAKRL